MRVAIYARVSSAAQRDHQTIRAQLELLPGWCAAQGWIVTATYTDDGKTARAGQLAHRSGLLELLDAAEGGAFDVVAVLDVDRLTRSEDHIERSYIVGRLQRARVKIASPASGLIDLDTFAGDVQIAISTASSADWLRRHCQRIKAGKDRAIAAGRKPAGPTPYGLRYDRAAGAWSIDPAEAEVVREIFRRVAAGEPTSRIADDFTARAIPRARAGTVWTRERVWNLATSATYRGTWRADKTRKLTVPVPAIVTEALWHEAQGALLAHGKRGLRRTKHCYLLEGLAVCGVCGARVGIASAVQRWRGRNGATRGATPARYVCGHRRRPLHGAAPCDAPIHQVDDVDGRLWAALERLITAGDRLDRAAAQRHTDATGDAALWARDLADARARLDRRGPSRRTTCRPTPEPQPRSPLPRARPSGRLERCHEPSVLLARRSQGWVPAVPHGTQPAVFQGHIPPRPPRAQGDDRVLAQEGCPSSRAHASAQDQGDAMTTIAEKQRAWLGRRVEADDLPTVRAAVEAGHATRGLFAATTSTAGVAGIEGM